MLEIVEFIERIDALREQKNMSDRALSMAATGKPDLVRTIRKRMALPTGDNLAGLARALETSIDHLVSGSAHSGDVRVVDLDTKWKGPPNHADLPVMGTAHGGLTRVGGPSEEDIEIEQTIIEPTTIISYVLRPRALATAKEAYAVYVEGESMSPRYGPGEMAVVDPRVPAKIGDDVIVQLSENGDDEITIILLKRLVRRSASFVELEQYNPARTFRVDTARVKHIHRICPTVELLN